jgi:hypothetical protein
MTDPTGAVEVEHGGETYSLRLTMRGIARLQAKHGRNLAGMLDGTAGDIPDMTAVLDLVSEALQKGQGLKPAEADDLADEIATADPLIIGTIIAATFPDAVGNARPKPKAKRD